MYPFERFTSGAKEALTLAQEEAAGSHRGYVGTEHLLLGLLRQERGPAAAVLRGLGIEIGPVRAAIERIEEAEPASGGRPVIPSSPVKRVIETAFAEAQQEGVDHVGTEHLLIGLTTTRGGVGARVLSDLGATREAVIAAIASLSQAEETARSGYPRVSQEIWRMLQRAGEIALREGAAEVTLEHLRRAEVDEDG